MSYEYFVFCHAKTKKDGLIAVCNTVITTVSPIRDLQDIRNCESYLLSKNPEFSEFTIANIQPLPIGNGIEEDC